VDNDELALVFQPIVDMVSSRILAVEALVRWHHPHRGLVPPLEFIPLAERTGAIIGIGEWVLAESMRTLALWNDIVPESSELRVHVNVSPHQLTDRGFAKGVEKIIATTGVAAERLVLEITESSPVGGEHDLLLLRELKSLGVQLALDDFGTGYSSLSQLGRLPVDELKIDKSFVDDLGSGRNRRVMAGVLALAGQLGMTPVVEGIERPGQVKELLAMGARVGQGYFYSRPISADAMISMLVGRCVTEPHARVPQAAA
jgi:EAL domain-containing protein (putative c-di-GMP-specific phosphodiesterase class I)